MDLDELQSVRDRERQTDKLQQLRESFYADAGAFIQQLRRERERAAERADDPFDAPDVNRLTDEINTAEGTVQAIFERRIGKIVKAASLAAADQPLDAEGMTAEEAVLFDSLVDDIVATRQRVLETLDGERDGADDGGEEQAGTPAGGETAPEPAGSETASESGSGVAAEDTPADPESHRPPDPGPDAAADPEGVAAADLMGSGEEPAGPAGSETGGAPATEDADRAPRTGEAGAAAGSERAADTAGERTGADQTGRSDPGPEGESDRGPEGQSDRSDPDSRSSRSDSEGRSVTEEGAPVRKDGGTGVDRETLRITADVGAIFGVDEREYDLAADDVVQLPAENARPLVERGAAERLD